MIAMDEERSHFLPNQSEGARVDNGGVDRISALPNEILLIILSLLPVRRAASTTVLSSRWLDLWKQIPNLKFNLESDRISQLPEQIISLILSFLPLKKAVATSVLSSRWSGSWKYTPNLDFNYDIFPVSSRTARADVRNNMEIVTSILRSHKALSLKQFRIRFLRSNKSAKWAVAKWLEFVFLRKVESLVLDFNCWVDLDKVVLGESLREISTIRGDPRTLIFFQSLKSLRLTSLEVSGEDIKLFLHNCPLLEVLMIHSLTLTSDIEVCGPLLKRLEISRCSGGKSIKVSAPNLTFMDFEDSLGKLLLENVPILVEARFEINTRASVFHHFASAASSLNSQLQILDILVRHLTAMWWTSAFSQMPNLKKLSINCIHVRNLLPVTRLIWASPRLEEFTLNFWLTGEEPTAYMPDIANAGRSPHQHLKVLHLDMPARELLKVVELVTYVSNNCIALRRIDILGDPIVPDDPALHLLRSQLPNHVQLSIRP